MKNPVRTGTMIALAAASLFATACKKDDASATKSQSNEAQPASSGSKPSADPKAMAGDDKTAKIHCEGINDCKGHGSCKSAQNACAGQNGCKGKSFSYTATEDECKTKGGTVIASKM